MVVLQGRAPRTSLKKAVEQIEATYSPEANPPSEGNAANQEIASETEN